MHIAVISSQMKRKFWILNLISKIGVDTGILLNEFTISVNRYTSNGSACNGGNNRTPRDHSVYEIIESVNDRTFATKYRASGTASRRIVAGGYVIIFVMASQFVA